MARAQRYQRSVTKAKDPQRVNTSTLDQDAKILQSQVAMLKEIWKEDEKPSEKVEKGLHYNSIDQQTANFTKNLSKWSERDDYTDEELEDLSETIGGSTFVDMYRAHKADNTQTSPLKLAIEGDKVKLAAALRDELANEYSDDELDNYELYSYRNQPIKDKNKQLIHHAKRLSPDKFSPSFYSKRGINLDELPEAELTQLLDEKGYMKELQELHSVKLTDSNFVKATALLDAKIKQSVVSTPYKIRLTNAKNTMVTKFQQDKLAKQTAYDNEMLEAVYTGKVLPSSSVSKMSTPAVMKAAKAEFKSKEQALDTGKISWEVFKQGTKDPRYKLVYNEKLIAKRVEVFRKIRETASGVISSYQLEVPKDVPNDMDHTIGLLYTYYSGRLKEDKNLTIDEARAELFSVDTDSKPHALLRNTHRHLDKLGLEKREYREYFRTRAGREKLVERAARTGVINKGMQALYDTAFGEVINDE